MIIKQLPFIHFLTRQGSQFLSPTESTDDSQQGNYAIPVQNNGKPFPLYRFQFSIYLGQGQFIQQQNQKSLFNGIAPLINKNQILLVYQITHEHFELPLLQISPRKPFKYSGKFTHPDFLYPFLELQPQNNHDLDKILELYGISIIGCDPFTNYI